MNLKKATIECAHCPRKFHQIDSTEDRALAIVRDALDRHMESEHSDEKKAS